MSPTPCAVILAAGTSRRLMPLTREVPKCLLGVSGRTLLDRQLDLLRGAGVDDVIVVTGHGADAVRAACGSRARCVHNPHYEATNSLYSLALSEEAVADRAMLLLNSDVALHPGLLRRLVEDPAENALLVDLDARLDGEAMKVVVSGGRVVAIDKGLDPAVADGENVGVVKFGRAGRAALFRAARAILAEGRVNAWAPAAYQEMLSEMPIAAIPTGGLPWIEIDFPDDLERAAREVVPRVDGAVPAARRSARTRKGGLRAGARL